MTTIAAEKIRKFRESERPKMTRQGFGDLFGVSGSTVQGWEEYGKIASAPILNAIARQGVAAHADWYTPALCTRCEMRAEDARVASCTQADCPLAMRRVA